MKRSGCTISSSKVVPDTGNPCSPTLEAICVRLIEAYTVENWWPADSPFEVLEGAPDAFELMDQKYDEVLLNWKPVKT
jgi:hypothetical protein